MTHLITKDSTDFIARNKNKPFFLFVSHESPHFPFQGPKDVDKKITKDNWMTPDPDTYVAMLEDLDSEVGRVLDSLKHHDLEQNTLVIFVSDNGGFAPAAHMGPLRGAKSTTLEGGIRVPLIMRWPGKLTAGQESSQVCATFDLTRSILNLTKAKAPNRQLEGIDIVQHLVERKPNVSRTLYWRGKRGERTWSAVRDGNLKFVRKTEGRTEEWLFDLSKDLAEETDLLLQKPKEGARLKALLNGWEEDIVPVR